MFGAVKNGAIRAGGYVLGKIRGGYQSLGDFSAAVRRGVVGDPKYNTVDISNLGIKEDIRVSDGGEELKTVKNIHIFPTKNNKKGGLDNIDRMKITKTSNGDIKFSFDDGKGITDIKGKILPADSHKNQSSETVPEEVDKNLLAGGSGDLSELYYVVLESTPQSLNKLNKQGFCSKIGTSSSDLAKTSYSVIIGKDSDGEFKIQKTDKKSHRETLKSPVASSMVNPHIFRIRDNKGNTSKIMTLLAMPFTISAVVIQMAANASQSVLNLVSSGFEKLAKSIAGIGEKSSSRIVKGISSTVSGVLGAIGLVTKTCGFAIGACGTVCSRPIEFIPAVIASYASVSKNPLVLAKENVLNGFAKVYDSAKGVREYFGNISQSVKSSSPFVSDGKSDIGIRPEAAVQSAEIGSKANEKVKSTEKVFSNVSAKSTEMTASLGNHNSGEIKNEKEITDGEGTVSLDAQSGKAAFHKESVRNQVEKIVHEEIGSGLAGSTEQSVTTQQPQQQEGRPGLQR